MSKAVENLRNYQEQLDEHGIMVGVSRQALDEALSELSELREAVRQHKESMLPEDACEEDRELWALLKQEGE